MSLASFVPLVAAIAITALLWRLNRTRRWFSVGELIFWGVVVLIVLQLVWLRWY